MGMVLYYKRAPLVYQAAIEWHITVCPLVCCISLYNKWIFMNI